MAFIGFIRGVAAVLVGGFLLLVSVMGMKMEPKERLSCLGLGLTAILFGLWKIKRFYSGVD